MAKRFLHIFFDFSDADPQVEKLQPVFDKAIDWLRYMPTCWIVWTSTSAEKWFERLRPLIKDTDELFIVAIDPTEIPRLDQ